MSADGFEVSVRSIIDDPSYRKCQRCLRYVAKEEHGEHHYWPTYEICKRCVGVLLDIKWPPYIMRSENDCYICENEIEWHKIKNGLMEVPSE